MLETGDLSQVLNLLQVTDIVIIKVDECQVRSCLAVGHHLLEVLKASYSVMTQVQLLQAANHAFKTLDLGDFVAAEV